MGLRLSSSKRVERLNKVKKYLTKNKVTSIHIYLQKAVGTNHQAANMIDRKIVIEDNKGYWRWNESKEINPKMADKLFEQGNERAKLFRKKRQEELIPDAPKEKKVSLKIEEDPSNKILSLMNNLKERVDTINERVEAIVQSNNEIGTRSRLDISDMRQDLSVMRRELPKIIKQSMEVTSSAA